jgi:hypothetical protein
MTEHGERDNFLHKFGYYLPTDFISGLDSSVSEIYL